MLAEFCFFLRSFIDKVLIKLSLSSSKRTNFNERVVDLSISPLKALKRSILNKFSSCIIVSTVADVTKVENSHDLKCFERMISETYFTIMRLQSFRLLFVNTVKVNIWEKTNYIILNWVSWHIIGSLLQILCKNNSRKFIQSE